MKPSAAFPRLLKFLSLIILVSLITACSAPADESSQDLDGPDGLPEHLGFVVDPEGLPVAFAIMGGMEMATRDGAVSGDFPEYNDQWIPVEAMGYATGYVKSSYKINDVNVFVTRMTPLQSIYSLESGETIQLSAYQMDEIVLSADLSADMFSVSPVTVGMGVIDRLDVEQRIIPFHAEEGLRLRYAFAIQAFVEDWAPDQLGVKSAIPLTIELASPLSDQAVFAIFDPVQGIWVEENPNCSTDDGLVFTCQLPNTNPLWAIYDQAAADGTATGVPLRLGSFSIGSLFTSSQMYLLGPFQQDSGTPDGNFQLAWDKLAEYLNNNQNVEIDANDPVQTKLVQDIVDVAMAFIKENRTEDGKRMLMEAGKAADMMDQAKMVEDINAEIGEISDEIGEKALNESDCGEIKKLIIAAEQVDMALGDPAISQQLFDKAREMANDCDIWTGWVRVEMFTAKNHPADLPMSGRATPWWREFHTIMIWTNVGVIGQEDDKYVMHAESEVKQTFPAVSYVEYNPCKAEIIMAGTPGKVKIYYEGFYDGIEFRIDSTDPQGEGGFITQTWDFNSMDEDSCTLDYYDQFFFGPYYSQIVHGIASESPPINLQEMLDEGKKGGASLFGKDMDTIDGREDIINPEPEMGLFPFHTGRVSWSFLHYQKKLPLAE